MAVSDLFVFGRFFRSFARAAAAATIVLAADFGTGLPAHAADWGLTLFVLADPPVSAGQAPSSYSPGSRAVTRLIFENRGEAPLQKIRVEVRLVGAVPVVSSSDEANGWKREGNDVRATIATLEPGASVELPLIVELADGTERGARGTGGEARIRASVPASGETLVAEASWPIASCADAYHVALRQIRYREFAALRAALDQSRSADRGLPGKPVFTYKASSGRDEASAVRFAEQIARTRGVDGYFSTQDIRWVSGRLINDIGVYLGQDRYPGLCTGVVEWTAILQDFIGRFTKRTGELERLRAAMEPAARQLVATNDEGGMDQGSGGIEAWETAAALVRSIDPGAMPGEGQKVFVSAYDALAGAEDTVLDDRRAALRTTFAALERLWYLEYTLARAEAVSNGFTGTLDAIRDAHRTTCTCGT